MLRGLSAGHLGELVAEIAPLTGGRLVREIQAHPPHDFLLILEPEGGGPILRLRLSADPVFPRLHLQLGPLKRHTGPPGPFYRLLGKSLAGARLDALARLGEDRIVRLEFSNSGTRLGLVAELTGRHANLALLDSEDRVLGVLVTPSEGSAAATRLSAGTIWQAPPGRPPANRTETGLAEEIGAGESPASSEPASDLERRAPLSSLVEANLGRAAETRHIDRDRKALTDRLRRRLKSTRHRQAGLELQSEATSNAERVRMDAELLTAHMHRVKRGLKSIELEDSYEEGSPLRSIELDPGLSPRRNVERLFSRYKKLLRSREKLPAELALATAQVEGLESLMERANAPDADMEALTEEAEAGGWLPRAKVQKVRPRTEPRLPYQRFFGCKGSEIRVGRSAKDNDQLTFKCSRGNDLWLHTSDSPGSHVILVLERGREADPEEVLDAAHLAAHFSPLKNARKIGVHIARRKEVKKPRRAPAGLVTLSGGQVRMIRMDPERLERVLATGGKPRPGAA